MFRSETANCTVLIVFIGSRFKKKFLSKEKYIQNLTKILENI